MQYNVLPLFKSHFSIGKSILTLENEEVTVEDNPDSIIAISKENNLSEIFLVEDSMSGFLQAVSNCKIHKIKLNFGIRLTVCSNILDKSPESLASNSKFVVFCKNYNGYKALIKIYSLAAKDGFYYEPRIDYVSLKKMWCDDLILSAPFYDSYIYNNLFYSEGVIPDLFTKVFYFQEDNDHPLDKHIKKSLLKNGGEIVKAKSIYYKNKSDFVSYLSFRAISERGSLAEPKLDHMCSDEFSFESWKKQNS